MDRGFTIRADGQLAIEFRFESLQQSRKVARLVKGPKPFVMLDALVRALKGSGVASAAGKWFLAGVAMQVVIAALNKASMWALGREKVERCTLSG